MDIDGKSLTQKEIQRYYIMLEYLESDPQANARISYAQLADLLATITELQIKLVCAMLKNYPKSKTLTPRE